MSDRKQRHLFTLTAGLAVMIFLTGAPVSCLANRKGARAEPDGNQRETVQANIGTKVGPKATPQVQDKKPAKKVVRLLTFEEEVHDFGDITKEDGPQTCVFKYSNQTDTTILILNVRTTCECTKAEWTRKPIKPGESGEIKVTYANEAEPHYFDKGILVQTSTWGRALLLRIKGTVKEKVEANSEEEKEEK